MFEPLSLCAWHGWLRVLEHLTQERFRLSRPTYHLTLPHSIVFPPPPGLSPVEASSRCTFLGVFCSPVVLWCHFPFFSISFSNKTAIQILEGNASVLACMSRLFSNHLYRVRMKSGKQIYSRVNLLQHHVLSFGLEFTLTQSAYINVIYLSQNYGNIPF